MNRFSKMICTGSVFLAGVVTSATVALAAPVLTNGDFEQNPPSSYGNNVGWNIAPWTLVGGDQANVVQVDGPGGQTSYGSNGPASDATGGTGPQHYLDIVGDNELYQEFEPQCSGLVVFGASFSARNNSSGTASVGIYDATGSNVVAGPASVTLPAGTSETDPWVPVTGTATLTSGTIYRLQLNVSNYTNVDNAFVEFESFCPAHNDDDVETPDENAEETTDLEPSICVPFEVEVSCDPNSNLPQITLSNALSGEFAPDDVQLTSSTSGVTFSRTGPMSVSVQGASAGQTLTLMSSSVQHGGGSSADLDACCMGEMEVTIPQGLECAPPELHVEKVCTGPESASGAVLPPEQCEITVTYSGPPPTSDNPITLSEDLSGGTWTNTSGGPNMSDPWNCNDYASNGTDPLACSISQEDAPDADWSDWTSTILVDVTADQSGFENCVTVDAGNGISEEACWNDKKPAIEIEKTCEHVENGLFNPIEFTCAITVTTDGTPFEGDLSIDDSLIWGTNFPFADSPPETSSSDPWACEVYSTPTNPRTGCTISGDDFPHSTGSSTVNIDFSFHDSYPEENCASVALVGISVTEPVCTPMEINDENDDETEPDPIPVPEYDLAKTCESDPAGISCEIVLTTNGVPFTGDITVSDIANLGSTAVATITGPAGASCTDSSLSCTISHTTLAGLTPPNTATFNVSFPGQEMPEGFMNCAVGDHATMPEARDCVLENGEFDTPDDPPEVSASCESDFVFVVDTSASVGGNVNSVKSAVRSMAQSLRGDSNKAAMITFGSTATVVNPLSTAAMNTLATSWPSYSPAGGTNWEDALSQAAGIVTANSVVIFITDGRPTAHLDPNGAPVAVANGPSGWLTATNEAIPQVNAIYAAGAPIIGIGISGNANGFVSTYRDALLGTTSLTSSFGALSQTMTELSREICGDVKLQKSMSPGSINFANEPSSTKRATVTLRASNFTNAPASNIQVVDQVPTELSALGNIVASHGSATITGQTVTWTIPTLANGITATLSFQGDLTAPAEGTTNWQCKTNYAQVTEFTGTMQSTVDNMDRINGPAREDDESEYRFCVKNDDTPTGTGGACVPKLRVDKVLDVSQQEVCIAGEPCHFKIMVRSTCPADAFDMPVEFGDVVTGPDGNTPLSTTIVSMSNDSAPAVCSFPSGWSSNATPSSCAAPSLQIPAQGSVTFDMTLTAPSQMGTYTNCFTAAEGASPTAVNATVTPAGQYQNRGDCTQFDVVAGTRMATTDVAPSDTSTLDLVKTLTSPCQVNIADQSYTCDFELQLTNTGTERISAPVALSDTFGTPKPRGINNVSGEGWDCASKGNTSATCLNSELELEAGESSSVAMSLTIPGFASGGSTQNCAAVGISQDRFERATALQTIMNARGIDAGPIDGVPGRKTRAGLKELQAQLGLPETGELDDAVFEQLGIPVARDAQSCVSVDLPHMPPPPLVCDQRTTRLKAGACECRYSKMFQRNKTSCGCVKGTEFVAGEGCIKRKPAAKKKPQSTNLVCNRATTVTRGGACACRYSNMQRANATSCKCVSGTEFVAGEGCIRVSRGGSSGGARCANGLPRLPLVGCIETNVKRGRPSSGQIGSMPEHSAPDVSVDPDPMR